MKNVYFLVLPPEITSLDYRLCLLDTSNPKAYYCNPKTGLVEAVVGMGGGLGGAR